MSHIIQRHLPLLETCLYFVLMKQSVIFGSNNHLYLYNMRFFFFLLFCFLTNISAGQIARRCSPDYDSTAFKKFVTASTLPTFPGGEEKLMEYITSKVSKYTKGMTKTFVNFVVDTLGQVRNVCILSQIDSEGLSESEKKIIEVFENMPKWTPGLLENKKVPAQFTLRVTL